MNDAITLEQAYIRFTDTLWTNTASVRIRPIIMDMLKKEHSEKRMRMLRASSNYDRAAARYYAKHGTVGEY